MKREEIDLESAVPTWCKNQFIMRSGYYSGRGVKCCDLNSRHLEMIYSGIKSDVGETEAAAFVRFVARLTDLSASAFICAFQRWWYAGCPEETKQESSDRYTLSGWGAGLGVEAWGCIASAMSMGQHDDSAYSVRGEFLRSHGQEIPEDARPDLMMMHYGEYGGWE